VGIVVHDPAVCGKSAEAVEGKELGSILGAKSKKRFEKWGGHESVWQPGLPLPLYCRERRSAGWPIFWSTTRKPPTVREVLGEGHPCFFMHGAVDKVSAYTSTYAGSGAGRDSTTSTG
jgi:hypothetical protein